MSYTVTSGEDQPLAADQRSWKRYGGHHHSWQETGREAGRDPERGDKAHSRPAKGQIWSAPDVFDPLTDDELRELGFEW